MSERLRKTIFAGCRELGLDSEMRRDLQLVVTNKASLSEMTDDDMQAVVDALKARGFKHGRSGKASSKSRNLAPRADLRYIHVLWKLLGDAGALNAPTRTGLNTFIRARFEATWGAVPADIDMLRDAAQINAVTRALKDWCKRENIETELAFKA